MIYSLNFRETLVENSFTDFKTGLNLSTARWDNLDILPQRGKFNLIEKLNTKETIGQCEKIFFGMYTFMYIWCNVELRKV